MCVSLRDTVAALVIENFGVCHHRYMPPRPLEHDVLVAALELIGAS